MPTFLYTTMSSMDERMRSLSDPAALVKIGVYMVEPTFFKIYDVSRVVGDTVEELLRSLLGPCQHRLLPHPKPVRASTFSTR